MLIEKVEIDVPDAIYAAAMREVRALGLKPTEAIIKRLLRHWATVGMERASKARRPAHKKTAPVKEAS